MLLYVHLYLEKWFLFWRCIFCQMGWFNQPPTRFALVRNFAKDDIFRSKRQAPGPMGWVLLYPGLVGNIPVATVIPSSLQVKCCGKRPYAAWNFNRNKKHLRGWLWWLYPRLPNTQMWGGIWIPQNIPFSRGIWKTSVQFSIPPGSFIDILLMGHDVEFSTRLAGTYWVYLLPIVTYVYWPVASTIGLGLLKTAVFLVGSGFLSEDEEEDGKQGK